MSAIVCGSKRSFFEELSATPSSATSSSPPHTKRRRFSPSGSPIRFSGFVSVFDQLRAVFPHMDNQILERTLEECDNDIDAAIKRLHELSLGHAAQNASVDDTNGSAEKDAVTVNGVGAGPAAESSSVRGNSEMGGAEWVELFVSEMMSATSIDDARSRATRILESLEKSITERAGTEAAQNYYKENVMLKEQIEVLLRDNNILKRAVAIQHERQKEYDNKDQEVHQLKQLLAQYQEQLRTLEVNNYALTLHLQQAQQKSSIPGRFNPDVF